MSIFIKFLEQAEWAVKRVVTAVRRLTRLLRPQDDWVERWQKRVYVAANPLLKRIGGYSVSKITEADFVGTVEDDSDAVERQLYDAGYQRNLLSSRKYRRINGDKQWSDGSFVFDPKQTDTQHHVILFDAADGGTDIYAHKERTVRDPDGHMTVEQTRGDPDNRLHSILS